MLSQFVPVYVVLIALSFSAAYAAHRWSRKLKAAELEVLRHRPPGPGR